VENKGIFFTEVDIVNVIYHTFFIPANHLGCQPAKSQLFQFLTHQTLVLAGAAIRCVLCADCSGKMATLVFSQDKYRCTFFLSPIIYFMLDATVLINHPFQGRFIPLPPALLQHHLTWPFSIPVRAPWPSTTLFHSTLDSFSFGTPPLQ